jgi:DNA-binding GntR family transcriptional regulator
LAASPFAHSRGPAANSSEPAVPVLSRHRIRDALQERILRGVHPPGEKLVQQRLAKDLGVAQSVVREALFELQACGLVEAVDNRGIFVTDLGIDRLLESFDVREVMEGLAARLACDRVTRAQARELAQIAEQMFALSKSSRKAGEAGVLDRRFHEQIVRLSGNQMLIRVSENYRVLGKVLRGLRASDIVHAEHLKIVAAIEAGNADEAEQISRAHIREAKKALEKQIAAGTFKAEWV